MNIKRAKQEIIDAVEAYLSKDEYGDWLIPRVRQRPILLLGAPGIGKTQIMEQAARECGVALVAYSITHHTRQSAIGLPFISKKQYGGQEYSVTEYTMSEIVASVYDKMEAVSYTHLCCRHRKRRSRKGWWKSRLRSWLPSFFSREAS